MRVFYSLAMMASLLFVAACTKESPPGGPGAEPGAAQGPAAPADDMPATAPADPLTDEQVDRTETAIEMREENTFTLKVPVIAPNVRQGSAAEVDLSIDRGAQFDQPVTLTFEPAQGLTITPETASIEPGQEDVTVTVQAEDGATIGEHQLKVIATPQSGKAVELMMTIDVTERS